MKKKYQVFVSSTYNDLIDERIAVMQCLLENDCIPVGMEQFPASGMSQMEYIKMMLDDCDYYILILAGKYGSLCEDGISYTEKEFDYAINKNIPIMSFLVDDLFRLSSDKCEQTPEGQEKLNSFRKRAQKDKLVKFYKNIDDLKAKVASSINNCIRNLPAKGWVRGDIDSTKVTLKDYFNDNSITESQITTIINNISTYDSQQNSNAKRFTYESKAMSGVFNFDYSNNNGQYIIGDEEYKFVTKWSKASDTSIYAYSDGLGIDGIARIKGNIDFLEVQNAELDFSSRVRTPNTNDIVIWKNSYGNYAATKIISIKDDTRGADHDELVCQYIIFKKK